MTGNVEIHDAHGNFAGIGAGAHGSITTGSGAGPAVAEIERALAELRTVVAQHAAELEDREGAEAAVADAEREVRSGQPQAGRLRRLLNEVTGAASGVSAVAAAASAVKDLLTGLG